MRLDASRAIGAYAGVVTIALVWMTIGRAAPRATSFDEIDVQRINVREPNGTLRLVLASRDRMPGVIEAGHEVPQTDRRAAGLLFFNDEGNENGGLIFDGHIVDGHPTNSGSLTFDRYGQDQTVEVSSYENGTRRTAGIAIIDRPDHPIDYEAAARVRALPPGPAQNAAIVAAGLNKSPRAYLGRLEDNSSRLVLRDGQGRQRLVLRVAEDGTAGIDFLDASGRLVRTIK